MILKSTDFESAVSTIFTISAIIKNYFLLYHIDIINSNMDFFKMIVLIFFFTPINLYANNSNSELSSFGPFLLFPLLFFLMYFLLIRPQTKRMNEHKKLISDLKVGDEVTIQGGIIGKVVKILDDFVVLSLNVNVEIIIKKDAIVNALPKGFIKQIR